MKDVTFQKRPLLLILIVSLLFKAAVLAVDPTPRLFIGDSLSYLYTALAGWIPPDRSFTYGYLVHFLAVWPHSLESLVLWQSVVSALAAWLVAVCLLRFFNMGAAAAAVCSLLCAGEPLQLLAERYVLSESFATAVFALYVLICFAYLSTRRLPLLAATSLAGILLISLRISFLPIVLFSSVALPFFARPFFCSDSTEVAKRWPRFRHWALAVTLSLVLSQTLLWGYRHLYATLIEPPFHGHPAYLYTEGLFLVSDFAPLLMPIDYPVPSQRAEVFGPSNVPFAPPQNRDAQRWYPDGICDRIQHASHGDEWTADCLARRTAVHALERDPLGAIGLGFRTGLLYFDRSYFVETLRVDEGYYRRVPEAQDLQYRERFGIDFNESEAQLRRSPPLTARWHKAMVAWYWFLLVLPLVYFIILITWRRWTQPTHWFCAVLLLFFLEGAVLTVTRPTARFLTTMAWLACIALGSSSSLYLRRRQGNAELDHV